MVRRMSPRSATSSRDSTARYRIDDIIGHGAMGIIAAVRDQRTGARYAMKFLRPRFAEDADVVERFQREIQAAQSLSNEHVVRVVDHGMRPDGSPFLVMEYLEGNDLEQELAERGPLPAIEAVTYIAQACVALNEAHAKGLVHRDLKPSNLFLARRPDGARLVKVLDFGVSKSRDQRRAPQFALTQVRAVLGSPAYIAPEQARCARDVDERADIWSLGVILYQLVTGQLPFAGDSVGALFTAVQCGKFTPVSEVCPGLSRELTDVIERCLKSRPEDRFASVPELAQALAAWALEAQTGDEAVALEMAASSVRPVVLDQSRDRSPRGRQSGVTGGGVSAMARQTRRLYSWSERHWPVVMAGLLVLGFAGGAALAPATSSERETGTVPTNRPRTEAWTRPAAGDTGVSLASDGSATQPERVREVRGDGLGSASCGWDDARVSDEAHQGVPLERRPR